MNFRRQTISTVLLALSILLSTHEGIASPYFEAGAALGDVKNGDEFFNLPNSNSDSFGFVGSFSFYAPVTSLKHFWHLELGLQNRVSTFTNSDSKSFAMLSPNLSARLEFSRFYVGAGYAPITFASKGDSGISGLTRRTDAVSYFFEGGLIWRIIPEFQIAFTYALEYGAAFGPALNSRGSEYGLRFRFPLFPKELTKGSGADFDGFRYPFGVMK